MKTCLHTISIDNNYKTNSIGFKQKLQLLHFKASLFQKINNTDKCY